MSKPQDLCEYLVNNTVGENNITFIRHQIESIKGSCFEKGYITCIKHVKKRRELEKQRRSKRLKSFLDYLSDMTHNK